MTGVGAGRAPGTPPPEACVGSAPTTGGPTSSAVRELEAIAARSWPAKESTWDDGWLLRATAGWTQRANSALPLHTPHTPAGDTHALSIERIERWYTARGLPPTVAVVGALAPGLPTELARRGWTAGTEAEVWVADLRAVVSRMRPRPDLPQVEMSTRPSPRWLGIYRGGQLPDHALGVLCGGDARFLTLELDGEIVGIGRIAAEPPWVGISAMEVVPAHRGRGLGRHLLHAVAEQALACGADRAWLQVEPDNAAACGLYRSAGFATHHTYRYHQLTDQGDDT